MRASFGDRCILHVGRSIKDSYVRDGCADIPEGQECMVRIDEVHA